MDGPGLLILDGHNIAYRSFFAIRGLSAADGHPTNALFGFIKTLNALRERCRPTHGCVVFDAGLPTERTDRLATYKAQRPPMPDDLRRQLPVIAAFLRRAAVPEFREPGQEADDVIATLARAAAADGARVWIASNDKDLYQLVNDRIEILPPASAAESIGTDGVRARTGVAPGQMVDWLALTGDAVDNIPGVPGIGPKTAARLLERYTSLENLWAQLASVLPERIRTLLAEHRPIVERNAALMRLRSDLGLAREWRACALAMPCAAGLLAFYEQWGLRSLARDLSEPRLL